MVKFIGLTYYLITKQVNINEAIKLKSEFPAEINYGGLKMKVYIVPLNDDDFHRFLAHFKGHRITDKTALLFSGDQQFTLHAIARMGGDNQYMTLNKMRDVCGVV
jgi:hypothetical protein